MSEKPLHQHPRILASFLNLTGAKKSYSLVRYLRQSRRLVNVNRSKRVCYAPPKGGGVLK